MTELPGLDLAAVSAWLDAARPGLRRGPLTASLIAGGKSNLTYRVSDGSSVWALRRPPLGHVLPTAHDMAREYRVISALAPTSVPVASPVAFCAEPDVLGVPFYVMSFVEGPVLSSGSQLAELDESAARRVSEQVADTLVALHRVDPIDVGLADFGRPDGFLGRQLSRWHKQWQASETRPLRQLDQVVAALTERLPQSGAPAIVHGDYRLTNLIMAPALDRIAAVVDWEMATIGDPLADVGLLYVYHRLAEDSDTVMPRLDPSAGFLTADQLTARYGATSGRSLSALGWYIGFGFFKLAVIAEGIAARHQQGLTVGAGFERFGEMVPSLLDQSLAALRKDG